MEKEKNNFKCNVMSKDSFERTIFCNESFKTHEEMLFHKTHNCENDKKLEWRCFLLKETQHCHCIQTLKTQVDDPILFPCCGINYHYLFLFNYHKNHSCVFSHYYDECCTEYFQTKNCNCLHVLKAKLDKWKEDYPLPFDKELANQPVD